MTNNTVRRGVHGLLAALACLTAHAATSIATDVHTFNIRDEDARTAVRDFGSQAGIAVFADLKEIEGHRTNTVYGELTVDAALRRLTEGTGLQYSYTSNGRGVMVAAAASQPAKGNPAGRPAAQPSRVAVASADDGATVIEQVIVTVQRRSENLQDVPVSAVVVGKDAQVRQHLENLEDMAQTLSSVHVGGNGRSNEIYIRGIGSGVNSSFDQSVGTFVDDIYHGRSRNTDATFLDLDRVEVLRGPQTTFFGNNAIAGAFNIVTRKPGTTDTADAQVRLLYGQYGQYAAEADVGGPLIPGLLTARAAAIVDGMEGWLKNVTADEHSPQQNNGAARLTLRLNHDDLDVFLKGEVSRNRNRGAFPSQVTDCPPAPPFTTAGFCKTRLSVGAPIGLNSNLTAADPNQGMVLNTVENVLTLNYTHWGHTFTAVSGYNNYTYGLDLDAAFVDPNGQPQFHAQVPEHYHQFSQELRAASATDQTLEYLGGVYFQDDRLDSHSESSFFFLTPLVRGVRTLAPLVPYLPLAQDVFFQQREHTYSAFASLTWNVTDALKVSPGLRGSWVNKDFDGNLLYGTATAPYGGIAPVPAPLQPLGNAIPLALGAPYSLPLSRQDHAWQPSAKIQYKLAVPVMAYFSYSRGFKAGGFNGNDVTGVAANLPYAPEHVDAYELGLKSEWLEGRLQLNADTFLMNYHDLQVASLRELGVGTFSNVVDNAASSRSEGVELQGQWIATRDLRVGVEATYLDARYLAYPNASPTALQQFQGLKFQDLSGRQTEYAPRFSGSVSLTYSPSLPNGYHLATEVIERFSASYYLSGVDDDQAKQGDFSRLDARITLATPGQSWSLDLIGHNLTNRTILVFGGTLATSPGSFAGEKEEPRSGAVQVRYRY